MRLLMTMTALFDAFVQPFAKIHDHHFYLIFMHHGAIIIAMHPHRRSRAPSGYAPSAPAPAAPAPRPAATTPLPSVRVKRCLHGHRLRCAC